jgi:UDPglucose 6-dehydrogenase
MTTPITVVMKSTVPVGTGDEVERRLSARRPDVKFDIVSNPEFLREGAAIEDFKRPDRVVVGAKTAATIDVMEEVYRPLFLHQNPMHFTNRKTSELLKYASNVFFKPPRSPLSTRSQISVKLSVPTSKASPKGSGWTNVSARNFLMPAPVMAALAFQKIRSRFSRPPTRQRLICPP